MTSTAITGTVRLALLDLRDRVQRIRADLDVEIDIGDGWPSIHDTDPLRILAWRHRGNIALTGTDAGALAYLVDFVRQARVDAEASET